MSAEILALLDPGTPDTWPQGILAAADEIEQEASRVSLGYGRRFDVDDPERGASLVDFLLALARHWRSVVQRHYAEPAMFPAQCVACAPVKTYDEDDGAETVWVPIWPCDDIDETADEARAYLDGGVR